MFNKGKFREVFFSECNLSDVFFDSLKQDYPGFEFWFQTKSNNGAKALVYDEDGCIKAFLYLKVDECEPIKLKNRILPAAYRIKIGTLKLSNDIQGQRLGEGAIGIALWQWQKSVCDEIYITVFDKHNDLTALISRYGFVKVGDKADTNEAVYIKSKARLDKSNPYRMFPYINETKIGHSGILPIEEEYHDKMFSYSELANTDQETGETAAANGIDKVYVAFPRNGLAVQAGDPIFLYRKFAGQYKYFRSVVTSVCTIVDVVPVKYQGRILLSEAEYLNVIGNKSIFSQEELIYFYRYRQNVVVLDLLYNYFFGKGNNITNQTMVDNELWSGHPYEMILNADEFKRVLQLANVNFSMVVK
ncbi:MAG: hypothetical protein KBS60_02950 [Phascolarctobacterium sp.]|nr:hypothetical protein [Candidatus Phascolarctobacterium caballi]